MCSYWSSLHTVRFCVLNAYTGVLSARTCIHNLYTRIFQLLLHEAELNFRSPSLRADFLPHEADVSEGEADDDFHDHGDEVRPDLEEGLSEAQVRGEGAVLVLDE